MSTTLAQAAAQLSRNAAAYASGPAYNWGFPADWVVDASGFLPPVAGGDPALPISLPLDNPTLNGTEITIDMLLAQPTRITRAIRDLTLQKFIADLIFSSAGGVTAGAVLYDQATANEIYLARDVQSIAPGGVYPIVGSERQTPKIAPVEKWGGKFPYTDEAFERNDRASFQQQTQTLANTIVRKNNQRAIEVVRTSITATGQSFTGNNWSTFQPAGNAPTAPGASPWADITKGHMLADQQELGVAFDTLLLNPVQGAHLANARVTAADLGISTIFISNRVPAGTAYMLQKQAVGGLSVEQPLRTVSWRDEDHDRTWVKSGVRNVMYVTNPFAIVEITNLAG